MLDVIWLIPAFPLAGFVLILLFGRRLGEPKAGYLATAMTGAAFLVTVGVMVRRNPLVMFMCVELMLNAVNLSFVAIATRLGDINGQTAVFFVLVVAAAEVVVGLGIIVSILRKRPGLTADDLVELKG